MKIALVLAAGILVGAILSIVIFALTTRSKMAGALIFYRDPYESDNRLFMSAELNRDIYDIYCCKYVIFKINDNIISVNNTQK